MKNKILVGLTLAILTSILCIHVVNKNYYYKTLWYNLPGIFDGNIFYSRKINKSTIPYSWPYSIDYKVHVSTALFDTLTKYDAISVLFIQHDSILVEQYFDGATQETRSNSFSMSKSFVGALIGRAIRLGLIESIDQPVSEFLKEFKEGDKRKITIRHLLTMSSGLGWDEAYSSLFSQTTEAYYGTDLKKLVLELPAVKPPGKYFEYKSCDTEILALIIEQATSMSLSKFLEKELWQPMGASDATWSLDHEDGIEKAYCCMYATPKDFARLGALYLYQGNWKGNQLIDSMYISQSITATRLLNPLTEQPTDYYGFQWWILPNYKGLSVFYMRGILGQNVVVIPSLDMIVVRLGHKRGDKVNMHYTEMYALLDEALKMQK